MIYHISKPDYIGKTIRPIAHYGFDGGTTTAELPGIDKVEPGSDAYNVDTGDVYILNSSGEWVEQ